RVPEQQAVATPPAIDGCGQGPGKDRRQRHGGHAVACAALRRPSKVRLAAASALGALGDEAAREALQKAADGDGNGDVRSEAVNPVSPACRANWHRSFKRGHGSRLRAVTKS